MPSCTAPTTTTSRIPVTTASSLRPWRPPHGPGFVHLATVSPGCPLRRCTGLLQRFCGWTWVGDRHRLRDAAAERDGRDVTRDGVAGERGPAGVFHRQPQYVDGGPQSRGLAPQFTAG